LEIETGAVVFAECLAPMSWVAFNTYVHIVNTTVHSFCAPQWVLCGEGGALGRIEAMVFYVML
jgi:hypothetical protein